MTQVFSDEGKINILHALHMNNVSVKDMRDPKTRTRISARMTEDRLTITDKQKERVLRSIRALDDGPIVEVVKFMMHSPKIGGDVVNAMIARKRVVLTMAPVEPKSSGQRYY